MPALAQAGAPATLSASAPTTPDPADPNADVVDFAADRLDYDNNAEIVTAAGNVVMRRQGNRLNANTVTWNRTTGRVVASGDVALTGAEGDTAYGDEIELTDTLRDGVVDNMLLVLGNGGRIAARTGTRSNDVTVLDYATYSPCRVVDDGNCPKDPLWQLNARQVRHDPVRHRIYYRDARLELLGVPIIALPRMSHPDGSVNGSTGLLVPNARYSRLNGIEVAAPYYFKLSTDADLTFTPRLYSKVLPALEVGYRRLTDLGAFQVGGLLTYGERRPGFFDSDGAGVVREDVRAYLHANGQLQFDPRWRLTFAGRVATDKTFLRRYDVTRDDRLRNFIEAERFGSETYLSVAGWAVQTLRFGDPQGQQAIALPAIDFRWRPLDTVMGGRIEAAVNSLGIVRTDGQDTRRALASIRWDLRRVTTGGQRITLTGLGRGDIYHSNGNSLNPVADYAGLSGFRSRAIGAAAIDVDWPLAGSLFGGQQVLSPRVQLAASAASANTAIPNEDSRAFDLEDSNLFSLNRFAGYDRWEDGARVTYGADWSLDLPGFAIRSSLGQSYRLSDKPALFPDGTGLTDRFSDYVGRTTVQFRRFLTLTHRFRLDKDNFAVRRNEIDAVVGTNRTYATVGYLRLNRNIVTGDLGDREEVRLGGRWAFARYWSVFGSTVVDLTSRREDPLTTADGFEPIRHRLGLSYEDECLEIGVTWRKDYTAVGDARTGSTYMFRIALKNLGR